MPNSLVYDTSCSTGGSGLPLEIVAFLAHSHPTTVFSGYTGDFVGFVMVWLICSLFLGAR